MKSNIPKTLLFSRLAFAFVIILLTLIRPTSSKGIVLSLMYMGIITDIFDGIIARRLNVSSKDFRILDTAFDLLFYASILCYIYRVAPGVFSKNRLLIQVIICLECLMYFVSLIKFRKLPSPHAILSKFWGLYLTVEFTLLIMGVAGWHFTFALLIGVIVHVDRVLIYTLIRQWDHDIPSCYHAFQLRQGKAISRRKIFNG